MIGTLLQTQVEWFMDLGSIPFVSIFTPYRNIYGAMQDLKEDMDRRLDGLKSDVSELNLAIGVFDGCNGGPMIASQQFRKLMLSLLSKVRESSVPILCTTRHVLLTQVVNEGCAELEICTRVLREKVCQLRRGRWGCGIDCRLIDGCCLGGGSMESGLFQSLS